MDHTSPSRQVTTPAPFVGHSLRSLDLRARHGLMLVAIKRKVGPDERTLVAPPADELLQAGDVLALLGSNDALARIEKIK